MKKTIASSALLAVVIAGALALSATGPDLVKNGGFEGGVHSENGGVVPDDWSAFFCDTPYTTSKCPALRRDDQLPTRRGYNPSWLLFGTPEYKQSSINNRVRSGTFSAQLYSSHRVHDGGFYQTIDTVPGQVCTFEAYVQTWAADKDYGTDGTAWTSDKRTDDDKANSVWRLGHTPGYANAFSSAVKWGRAWGYEDGHYDAYARIYLNFIPTSFRTTIYIRQTLLWPLGHNEGYVDDVSVKCYEPAEVTETAPAPTTAPNPTQSTEVPGCFIIVPECANVKVITATPVP